MPSQEDPHKRPDGHRAADAKDQRRHAGDRAVSAEDPHHVDAEGDHRGQEYRREAEQVARGAHAAPRRICRAASLPAFM